MSYVVQLTYFKPGGKYYATGEYITDKEQMHQIWDEVEDFRKTALPGLCEGSGDYWIILVTVPGHPHDHPRLLMPKTP